MRGDAGKRSQSKKLIIEVKFVMISESAREIYGMKQIKYEKNQSETSKLI